MRTELNDKLTRAGTTPDMTTLQKEYERSGVRSVWWQDESEDTRFMRWNGQSTDGRKHRDRLQTDPYPWENAFDTRVPTVDGIVNYLTSIMLVAFDRAVLRCEPVEAGDLETAAKLQKVMEYYRNLLRRPLREEAELLLQSGLTYGAAAWQIGWSRALSTKAASFSMDDAAAVAAQAPKGSPLSQLPTLLLDPALEDTLADMALALVPDLRTKGAARRFVRALRNEGVAEYRSTFVSRNCPYVRALRLGRDLFLPPETTDLQRARILFVRDFLTEAELRERAVTEGWNSIWVEGAAKMVGRQSVWMAVGRENTNMKSLSMNWQTIDVDANLVEIVHAYSRQLDDQDIPTMMCTVFCPSMTRTETGGQTPLYGVHYRAETPDNEYPMAMWQCERTNRRILSSRGVPEVAFTWQLEEKTQCDMLGDLSSISVNPPLRVPMARGQQYKWGPGAQNAGRPGEVESININASNAGLAFQIMEMLRRRRAEYYGIMDETVPAPLWQARLASIVGSWLAACEEMFAQMAAQILHEDNVSNEELSRVTGLDMADVDRSPEAISRRFDWRMQFDARDLDMDYTLKKLETIAQLAVPLDREGMVNYSSLVRAIMTQVDPTYATALMGDPTQAADKIKTSVDSEFVRMLAGNEANYVENDPTAKMKMDAANEIVAKNPKYQQAYTSDPRFKEVVDNFQKNLQQSLVQQENKQVGRTGVKPVS